MDVTSGTWLCLVQVLGTVRALAWRTSRGLYRWQARGPCVFNRTQHAVLVELYMLPKLKSRDDSALSLMDDAGGGGVQDTAVGQCGPQCELR